jgi:hypothetical protein
MEVQNTPKCQRPPTDGARTSGAAELLSGRPSAGAMKRRRRRSKTNRNDQPFFKGSVKSLELANSCRFD